MYLLGVNYMHKALGNFKDNLTSRNIAEQEDMDLLC